MTFDALLKLQNLISKKQKSTYVIIKSFSNIIIFIPIVQVLLYLRQRFAILLLAS